MIIFVTKLSFDTQSETIRDAFEKFGRVVTVTVNTNRATGRSKGTAFVEMANDPEAWNAIERLNGSEMDGRVIEVAPAPPRL